MKVIDSLLNIIEKHINEIKKKKILLNEETVGNISIIFFNTGRIGSTVGSKEEKNKFKSYFDENNRLNKLLNLFKYLISQTLSVIQKETLNSISVTICLLLKNERPPLCYGCVLEYVNKLKSSPSRTSGHDFPLAAKCLWNKMLKADECLFSYLLKEIIVIEDFEIKNGYYFSECSFPLFRLIILNPHENFKLEERNIIFKGHYKSSLILKEGTSNGILEMFVLC
jgi:hypothetical protein